MLNAELTAARARNYFTSWAGRDTAEDGEEVEIIRHVMGLQLHYVACTEPGINEEEHIEPFLFPDHAEAKS